MTPISFFPFTAVTQNQEKTLTAFFSDVRVLSLAPSSNALTGITFCPLSQERASQIEAKTRAYLDWARLHKGNERNLRHLILNGPYFKEETHLTSIRSQIQGRGQDQGTNGYDPGLFLKLAQILDQERETIDQRLSALDQGRADLLAELKGEAAEAPVPGTRPFDSGATMPGERVAAWAALAQESGFLTGDPGLLVTTSPAIMDFLSANGGQVINGLDIDSIKVHENGCENRAQWCRDLMKLLDQIVAGALTGKEGGLAQASGCCEGAGRIQVCTFPDGNQKLKIPGRQLTVCLVELNS